MCKKYYNVKAIKTDIFNGFNDKKWKKTYSSFKEEDWISLESDKDIAKVEFTIDSIKAVTKSFIKNLK